ncbi:MAG: cupin domain-containing protein [Kofleriaceae bacterium]
MIGRKPAADLPGWETRLYLIEYPPGAAAPVHVHPAIGVGFVIDGRFESAFGDEPVVEVQRGQGFVDQADVPHRVFRNPSVDHGLRFVVAYTLRVGEEPLHLAPATTVLNQPALFPESAAYDEQRGRFLVGSFREGGVYEVFPGGDVRAVVQDPRLVSVLGIAVDATRGRLLVTNADLGAARRSSPAGPKTLAALGIYELASGAPIHYVDLGALLPKGNHLANGLTVDAEGNAYVTDSFSPVIYKVTPAGQPSVFLEDHAFEGVGIGLNGLAYHPDGYLLVVKKSDGKLFRVPVADSRRFTEVELPRPLIGADGVVIVNREQVVVISNETSGVVANEAVALDSHDGWRTATITAVRPLGKVYPTSGVIAHGTLFAMHSGLNQLIAGTPAVRDQLQNRATIQPIGRAAPLQLFAP